MDWTRDDRKAAANFAKHGVSFDAAALALADPRRSFVSDPHPDGDHRRTLGKVAGGVLFVVHTQPTDGAGRIISARQAGRRERNGMKDYQASDDP